MSTKSIFMIIFATIITSCKDSSLLSEISTTRYFKVYFSKEDLMGKQRLKALDEGILNACSKLKVPLPKHRIHYYKYISREIKEKLSGYQGNGFALLSGPPDALGTYGIIHTINSFDLHEMTHIILFPWGVPTALLREGIAVFMTDGWQGVPLKTAAANALKKLPSFSLIDLFNDDQFLKTDDLLSYAIAGGFADFLIKRGGLERFMNLYKAIAPMGFSPHITKVEKIFKREYNQTLKQIEVEFISALTE